MIVRPGSQAGDAEGLPAREYPVVIGRGLLSSPPVRGRSILVHDERLPGSIVDRALEGLAPSNAGVVALSASETCKSLASFEMILVAMAQARLERDDTLVSLGGGIVTDVAGFAASAYQRGIAHVACPTTLLAMVDASVGGKTGVNLRARGSLLKNMVGTFHQPAAVIADLDTLASLPARDWRAGLGECVKHALLAHEGGDPDLLGWTRSRLDQAASPGAMPELAEFIARNVSIKARIVGEDERETSGRRALLNLGHTFAHAIETIETARPASNDFLDPPLLHGEAVAIGLVAAARVARLAGWIPEEYEAEIGALVAAAGLPSSASGLAPTEAILDRMRSDKKVRGGTIRLVLPCGPGRARVADDPDLAAVRDAIRAIGGR